MRRLLLGAALAAGGLALAPGAAGAATVDVAGLDDGGQFRFTPPDASGQPGDTVQWGFAQATAPHNVNLVPPGVDPANTAAHELLGISAPAAATPFSKVLDQPGVYLYYCSFHGGLAPGGMSGRIVIGAAGDPPPPPLETGPAPQPNVTVFSSPLEEGDVVAPALTKVGALAAGRRLRVRYQLGEAAALDRARRARAQGGQDGGLQGAPAGRRHRHAEGAARARALHGDGDRHRRGAARHERDPEGEDRPLAVRDNVRSYAARLGRHHL